MTVTGSRAGSKARLELRLNVQPFDGPVRSSIKSCLLYNTYIHLWYRRHHVESNRQPSAALTFQVFLGHLVGYFTSSELSCWSVIAVIAARLRQDALEKYIFMIFKSGPQGLGPRTESPETNQKPKNKKRQIETRAVSGLSDRLLLVSPSDRCRSTDAAC